MKAPINQTKIKQSYLFLWQLKEEITNFSITSPFSVMVPFQSQNYFNHKKYLLSPFNPSTSLTGQSNGYCSQEWNCTASSCSSLPTPATPPFNPPFAPGPPLPNFLLPLHTQSKYQWLSHNNAGDKVHNKVSWQTFP